MHLFRNLFKTTLSLSFVIIFIFFSTLNARNLDKFDKANDIANYFSGVLLFNDNQYQESQKYLKKLDGLEERHKVYSKTYLYSLVNSGNFNQAFNYSKKIEKEGIGIFESDLILGIYYLKNSKINTSKKYFLKARKRNSRFILNDFVAHSLNIWTELHEQNLEQAIVSLDKLDRRFENLRKIQSVFINCYFGSNTTDQLFNKIINSAETDFSRYNYFYANYLNNTGNKKKAKNTIELSLKKYPRNLLINQFKLDLDNKVKKSNFNCKNQKHVIAEIIYVTANALSSQSYYPLSNFYLNLSKYLNQDFYYFDILLAENYYKNEQFNNAKSIYKNLIKQGQAYAWYSSKQIARILIQEDKKNESLKLLKATFNDLINKGVYEIFDYAEFLKNNEEFEDSIKLYTKILSKIDKTHPLYPEATDGRGVSYERSGQWDKAEKDFLESLEVSPNQAYVINYLAYSWIEQGIKINQSLEMLEKANKLRSNDPFIIDSLGWALFKLERYNESKKYLQLAVKLMPADPIVNDHYGDALWKNGNQIQARYYWNYVLGLKETKKDLKEKIEKKLIKGL